MSKRFIGFGSIDQFRTVIKNVQHQASYQGQDENDEPIFDNRAKKPIIVFDVSEKSHGSNAGFSYNNIDKEWFQSRKNIITPLKDNAGCAFMMEAKKDVWIDMIQDIAKVNNIDLDTHGIVLYSELQGGNIQKNAACSGLEKSFMIFQYCKVYEIDPSINEEGKEKSNYWVETKGSNGWVESPNNLIYNAMILNSFQFTIDFNEPLMYQNKMIEMVDKIEKNSIIGEKLGVKGNIGEGFVFQSKIEGILHRFKTKGLEHSKGSGKVKTLKPVDEAFENLKITFVNETACTEGRLNQMFTEIVHSVHNGDENLMTKSDIKMFLQLMFKDVIKEEMDKMLELGIEPKSINGMISKVSVGFFNSELDRIAGM